MTRRTIMVGFDGSHLALDTLRYADGPSAPTRCGTQIASAASVADGLRASADGVHADAIVLGKDSDVAVR